MDQKIRCNEYRTTMVCIDSYENNIMVGRLYNSFLKEGREFNGLMQYLLLMDNLLNDMKYPQPFMKTRRFNQIPDLPLNSEADNAVQMGKLVTLAVKILFQQNASWQGSITWLDRGREENFRSVLELVFLMNDALRSTK